MKKGKPGAMEILWLAMAAISLMFGVLQTIKKGFEESYMFFIFIAISLIMYYLRKTQRKRIEKEN